MSEISNESPPAVASDPSAPVEQPPAEQPAPVEQPPADQPAPVLHASGVEPNFTGLTLQAFRLEDQGCWSFGVTMAGVYVELGRKKLGGLDDDLREAANPGFKETRAKDAFLHGLVHL